MPFNILVAGAGAVGGLLCAYLHAAGHRVSLLARGQNAEQIDAHGIHLSTPSLQSIEARPRVIADAAEVGLQNLVIVRPRPSRCRP
jgi:2-dehydropantoate 2-reductase